MAGDVIGVATEHSNGVNLRMATTPCNVVVALGGGPSSSHTHHWSHMARSRPTILKRQREQARQEKRRDKAAKRAARNQQSRDRPSGEITVDEVDPDIAHIVPGPQPVPWDDDDRDETRGSER